MRSVFMAAGLAALALCACGGPSGRVKADTEEDLVGDRRAGAETFTRLVEESVDKLLARESAQPKEGGKLRIAFLGVENRGAEELGDWRENLFQTIDGRINGSRRYRNISDRFVNAALRETRLSRDELYIPAKRREFVRTLEASGNPVEFLLYCTMTTGTTDAGDASQRDYVLTLELVDVVSGESEKINADVRKEYLR